MSRLLGFKYTEAVPGNISHQYRQYCILHLEEEHSYIDYCSNGNGKVSHRRIDITEKATYLCQQFSKLSVFDWDMNDYRSDIDWFGYHIYWTLEIKTDDFFVSCKGIDAWPPNWDNFKKVLNETGIII